MAHCKHIGILGSTGSIGQNSLNVIAHFPERFGVSFLSTNTNITLLQEQIARFHPKAVAVMNEEAATALRQSAHGDTIIFSGERGLLELIRNTESDTIINALVGFAGLRPTIEAIQLGITVALANKETLVVAGRMITELLKKHNATLLPIDSEHSAILQCLAGENSNSIARLILTASGGPFLNLESEKFKDVTIEAALNHPRWKMGNKITIDSATLMNKGLEVIEAHWLFNLPAEKIDILIHPQSIIHSMVEFVDGSVKAQLGVPDMKIPIQYALTYPDRLPSLYNRVNFPALRELTFLEPDHEKFRCARLAYRALESGGTIPAVLNAANEVAVDLFLHREIAFDRIPHLIEHAMDSATSHHEAGLDEIIEADREARRSAKKYAARKSTPSNGLTRDIPERLVGT